MSKKSFYVTLGVAILTFIALLFYFVISNKRNSESNEVVNESESTELGAIELSPDADVILDDYEGDADYDLDVKEYYIGFTNLETVYDLLTLEAISKLPDDLAEFLNTHGYGDVHTLTVKEDSIVYDKSYPYFICSMENMSKNSIEVRYDVVKGAFEFKIIEN